MAGWRRLAPALPTVFALLLMGCAHRAERPTKPGWALFPRSSDTVFAQNELLWAAGHGWGRADVRRAVEAAASAVQKKAPGARVAYLDVSLRGGGRFPPHLSHRRGNDIDIMYFGRWPGGGLFPLRPHPFLLGYAVKYGRKARHGALRFDAERTWLLLMGLRRQKHARVAKIFVEPYIEEWLLAEGRRQGAGASALRWAEQTLRYAGANALDHKDHMHVRFAE